MIAPSEGIKSAFCLYKTSDSLQTKHKTARAHPNTDLEHVNLMFKMQADKENIKVKLTSQADKLLCVAETLGLRHTQVQQHIV